MAKKQKQPKQPKMPQKIKEPKKQIKLRTKLFAYFTLVAMLPLFLLGALSYETSTRSLHEQLQSRLSDYTDRSTAQLESMVTRYAGMMDGLLYQDALLARARAVQSGQLHHEAVRLYLEDAFSGLQSATNVSFQLDFLFLGDRAGYNNNQLEQDVNNRLTMDLNAKRMMRLPQGYCFGVDGRLHLLRTLVDFYTGQEVGYLVLTMNQPAFFAEAFAGQNSDFGLVVSDGRGAIVTRQVGSLMLTGSVPMSQLRKATPQKQLIYNNHTYLCQPKALSFSGWSLYVITSYEPVRAQTEQTVRITAIAMLLGLGLVLGIAWLLAAGITRRIETLSVQMKQVATGNLLVEPAPATGDEISQLSQVFEGMVSKLQKLIRETYVSKLAQREAEMKALQAQINPHFLYNCLDNMNWYAMMRGDEHSSYIITQLSDFYRTSLNRGRNTLCVREELKNVTAYMNLQLELQDGRFIYEQEIEPGLEDFITINLMLQPVLENAIKHGVNFQASHRQKPVVRLTAKRQGEDLYFSVFNSGSQISQEVIDKLFVTETSGYGLKNVQDRIKLLMGEPYGVTIRPVAGGTLCEILIPQLTDLDVGRREEQA